MSEFEEEMLPTVPRRKRRNKPPAKVVALTKKPLDKRFDAAKQSMAAPPKRIQLAKSQRKRGRPNGGHVKVSQPRIDALEPVTYEAKLARTLGIGRGTLAQWIDPKQAKYPLPFVAEDGHRLFRKDIVKQWLKETGRYEERDEYKQ